MTLVAGDRFQDADESAYHEYVLKRAGIRVHYCGEQFANDGSMASALMKTLNEPWQGNTAGNSLSKSLLDNVALLNSDLGKGALLDSVCDASSLIVTAKRRDY